jgi:hypothetical protein
VAQYSFVAIVYGLEELGRVSATIGIDGAIVDLHTQADDLELR